MSYLEDRLKRKNGILPSLPTKKERKPIPRQSDKKKKEVKALKESGNDGQMDLFFQSMRPKMTGRCLFTGEKSLKKNDEMFHFSIAHLLPKRQFKSIATHPENWIELSWNAHTDFDNGKISWEMIRDSAEWSIIRPKLKILLPLCTSEEKKLKLYSKLKTLLYGKD